jgi:hypothetical protein
MEFIGKIVIDNLLSFGIATILIAPMCAYLYAITKKYAEARKGDMVAQLELINDPEVRAMVKQIIVNVELSMGSVDGQIKFEKAKQLILKKVPDIFDPFVDKFIQGVYDGMKQNLTVGK